MKTKPIEVFHIDEDSQLIIDQMYQAISTEMNLPDGSTTTVPESGSLGLMAFGYKGIIAWRKTREQVYGSRVFSPYLDAIKKAKEKKEEENYG